MKIYVGYKYRNSSDKEKIKDVLSEVSSKLVSMGHTTFILGRDKFQWVHHTSPSKSLTPIIKNMKKSDAFLAIIECSSKSNGLLFESLCAKIFGKKIILAVKDNISPKPFSFFTKNIIKFEDYGDLTNELEENLPKYL
ncbi:MAG TPA: hypothetical protein PKH50_01920 [bacterium]|jgi:hypothetical protein|nr:hypothetical protein [bacterium]